MLQKASRRNGAVLPTTAIEGHSYLPRGCKSSRHPVAKRLHQSWEVPCPGHRLENLRVGADVLFADGDDKHQEIDENVNVAFSRVLELSLEYALQRILFNAQADKFPTLCTHVAKLWKKVVQAKRVNANGSSRKAGYALLRRRCCCAQG